MSKKIPKPERLRQANQIHDNKYDYSYWDDNISLKSTVKIICPIHGQFEQLLKTHIQQKCGCPKCASIGFTTIERISQANKIHNNKYDYSVLLENKFIKIKKKVNIKCPVHGIFSQTLDNHINNKRGCPKCANTRRIDTYIGKYAVPHHKQKDWSIDTLEKINSKEWLKEQHIVQQKSQIEIARLLNLNITTVGRRLDEFEIEKFYGFASIPEKEVIKFIKGFYINTILTSTRKIIPPYELDIYIPDHNLAIEYCGLYWHSEQAEKNKHYHKRKYDMCKAKGIQLITVFEDEWFDRQEQVKSKIKSLLHKDSRTKIFARKTEIVVVSKKIKSIFFEENHIQGNGNGSINIGLTCNDKLVACMSFIKQKNNNYELSRFATSCRVPGGFSKLLKYFISEYNPKSIISFADLRWSTGNLYTKTGWLIDKILPPDYSYSPDAKQRFHKFNYRRKNLANLLKNYDPELSERVNCDNNGILRIWDCGKIRFKYTPLTL